MRNHGIIMKDSKNEMKGGATVIGQIWANVRPSLFFSFPQYTIFPSYKAGF